MPAPLVKKNPRAGAGGYSPLYTSESPAGKNPGQRPGHSSLPSKKSRAGSFSCRYRSGRTESFSCRYKVRPGRIRILPGLTMDGDSFSAFFLPLRTERELFSADLIDLSLSDQLGGPDREERSVHCPPHTDLSLYIAVLLTVSDGEVVPPVIGEPANSLEMNFS